MKQQKHLILIQTKTPKYLYKHNIYTFMLRDYQTRN